MAFRMTGWIRLHGSYTRASAELALKALGVETFNFNEATKKFSVQMTDKVWVTLQTCTDQDLVRDRELWCAKRG